MGPSQQRRGVFDIEAMAPVIVVDHSIRLPNYFRIADSLLTQANVYRAEKNLIQLYVLLLRYSSLLCETIPKHRDYRTFKSGEKDFFKKKLLDVIAELESLKPVIQQKITELDVGATAEPHCLNGTYAVNCRIDKHSVESHVPQDVVRHQLASSSNARPDRQIHKQNVTLPYPQEETLSRHSILGPDGLSRQCIGPVVAMKVQYPTNNEITQSDISSLVPAILNQDGLHGDSKALPYGSRTDNETRLYVPVEDLCEQSIQQSSYPPILSQVHVDKSIFNSRVANSKPEHSISYIVHYRRIDVPEELTACFLKAAERNTIESLETCGLIFGALLMDPEVGEYFKVTALIIPKQKSTSDTCEATCEEEIPEVVQSIGSPYQLGWIHTHPTQDCFMSSVDLHNHYSYQKELHEAFAIVLAPSKESKRDREKIFHLTDPGGMRAIGDCNKRSFHPHDLATYKECSHIKLKSALTFRVIDLR
ncbi:unnamed protein product [Urochloa decumbens]|uniref:MPN domain-containing protein n=1 Tax=Urochloa decumbens TaxID=240449 RepID=A0ABC8ZSV0_9POAL